jgi:PII-like signaling protein
MLALSSDQPIMITVIDIEENVRRLLPVLDQMVGEGLIAMSDVEVIKYVHQGGTDSTQQGVTTKTDPDRA